MNTLPDDLKKPLVDLLLSVADDKCILGHRNADWTGLGPILEEDIAFSSLAQDDLAHAMALYEMVAGLTGSDANRVAYGRALGEYRCCELVELHDEFDWSVAIVRQFLCDHFEQIRLGRLASSAYEPLRHLSLRMLAEERLAIGHADQWIVRLGRAGEDARRRIQTALNNLVPRAAGLFEPTEGVEKLEAAGVFPKLDADPFDRWADAIGNVIEDAALDVSPRRLQSGFAGGRRGRHSAAFEQLLDEMTEVYRVEPGAAW